MNLEDQKKLKVFNGNSATTNKNKSNSNNFTISHKYGFIPFCQSCFKIPIYTLSFNHVLSPVYTEDKG